MAKYKLGISDPAKRDLDKILDYTEDHYGRNHAKNYLGLIQQAFKDLENNPLRAGTVDRSKIHTGFRTWHIALSKTRAGSPIKSPRHMVLYFVLTGKKVVISRLVYDGMDLKRHLPDEHKKIMKIAALPKAKKPSRTTKRKR